jgi:hypothetical protein
VLRALRPARQKEPARGPFSRVVGNEEAQRPGALPLNTAAAGNGEGENGFHLKKKYLDSGATKDSGSSWQFRRLHVASQAIAIQLS